MKISVDIRCAQRINNHSPSMGFDLSKTKSSSGVAENLGSLDTDSQDVEAKRNNFGVSSAGTVDYRDGAGVRPFEAVGNEVFKKRIHGSEAIGYLIPGQFTTTRTKNWWDELEVVKMDGFPSHIPEKEIMKVMPEELKESWENFLRGQTGLCCENGDFGVYAWDFQRFIGKLERGQPLVDTLEEWD